MSIKAVRWILLTLPFFAQILLGLSACSDSKPVVIQPGVFSEDWPTALRGKFVEAKNCVIDQINGQDPNKQSLIFKSGESLNINGWAISKTDEPPPPIAYVQLVGPALSYTALAQKRTSRSEVIQYFKLDSAWNPGFELQATQNAEPGVYRLEILQPSNHGIIQCEARISIKIDPASPRA